MPCFGSGTPTSISEIDQRSARHRLRRFTVASLADQDLEAETDHWSRLQLRYLGDLEAGDFTEGDEVVLRNGVRHCDLRLGELAQEAERRLRVRGHPAYPRARILPDLTPRFEAARYCDLVGLAETLTGQSAVPCGHGRWKLRCPFHGGGVERTPSLVIYEPGRGWHCFGCGLNGDAVDFISALKHVGSVEALLLVEELADTCPEAWSRVLS